MTLTVDKLLQYRYKQQTPVVKRALLKYLKGSNMTTPINKILQRKYQHAAKKVKQAQELVQHLQENDKNLEWLGSGTYVVRERLGSDYYYSDFISLQDTVQRWQQAGQKLYDDSQPVLIPTKELWKHREYTWSREDARLSKSEWDLLKKSVKRTGWKLTDPAIVSIGRTGLKVAEGNHRLSIAREIGIREIPVRFNFYSGSVRKSPQHPEPYKPKKPVKLPPRKPTQPQTPEQDKAIDEIMDLIGGNWR